jgi:diguanylate cyclase (GGDEF)-like protein
MSLRLNSAFDASSAPHDASSSAHLVALRRRVLVMSRVLAFPSVILASLRQRLDQALGRKLIRVAMGLLLIPLAIQLGFFFLFQRSIMQHAQSEIDGLQHVRASVPVLAASLKYDESLPSGQVFLDMFAGHAEAFALGDQRRQIASLLDRKPIDRPALEVALHEYIKQVAARSKIVFHERSDQSALVDVAVTHIPELLRVVNALSETVAPQFARPSGRSFRVSVKTLQTKLRTAQIEFKRSFARVDTIDSNLSAHTFARSVHEAEDLLAFFASDEVLASSHSDPLAIRDSAADVFSRLVHIGGTAALAVEQDTVARRLLAGHLLVGGCLLILALAASAIVMAHIALSSRVGALDRRIVFLAEHDSLTGLFNRRIFMRRFEEARNDPVTARNLAVLFLDLDRFKAVNDTFGHKAGDELLRTVAHRLVKTVRDGDTVARLGGDEFAILITASDPAFAAKCLGKRLLRAFAEPVVIEGQVLSIGSSIGVATTARDQGDAATFVHQADLALYAAKSEGKGRLRLFETQMQDDVERRRVLESELRVALESNALFVHYQPLVDTETGALRSCEALLRWTHPIRGSISPAEFIPLAEESGLIQAMGRWVLREACTTALSWPSSTRVAVNISPVQFRAPTFVADVAAILIDTGFPPSRLDLEVTETVFISDPQEALRVLQQLKALGIHISIDDFGTGYSSLAYLCRFPFDKIKIDRSFVQRLGAGPEPLAIVKAVTNLAASLGLATTAEGVETEEQRRLLAQVECAEIQGFLVSRPIAADQLMQMFETPCGTNGLQVAA